MTETFSTGQFFVFSLLGFHVSRLDCPTVSVSITKRWAIAYDGDHNHTSEAARGNHNRDNERPTDFLCSQTTRHFFFFLSVFLPFSFPFLSYPFGISRERREGRERASV
jgi:hypothetical protein